ncbi:MAG: DUF58 domain-containing protein [Planctomycetota bacterium]
MRPDLADVHYFTRDVRFPDDYAHRLARAKSRVRGVRERTEGRGPAGLLGAGEEFVGFRPYALGEDLRQLDWSLLARSDRAYVRVMRRESSEHWLVRLDATASMGAGVPSKLQLGAELALALGALGLDAGASVRVEVVTDGRVASALTVRARPALTRLRALLESTCADGAHAHAPLRARHSAQRVFMLGDFADVQAASMLATVPPRTELTIVQLVARHELAPPAGPVRWVDPETGEELALDLDERARAPYLARLGTELERWRAACARRGVKHAWIATDTPFELALARILGG